MDGTESATEAPALAPGPEDKVITFPVIVMAFPTLADHRALQTSMQVRGIQHRIVTGPEAVLAFWGWW